MEIVEIASCVTVLVSVLTLWRASSHTKFDKIYSEINKVGAEMKSETEKLRVELKEFRKEVSSKFGEVSSRFDKVENRLQDIAERVAFLEGETLHTSVAIPSNPRSSAAKEMWKRRRVRKLARKVNDDQV